MAQAKAPLSVTVYGGRELRKALKETAGDTDDLKELNKKIAEIVVDEAVKHVPVRSGKLKASIKAFGAATKARVTAGRKSLPYATVIHWGWPQRNIEASLFLTKAMEIKQPEILDAYHNGLEKILDKNGLK